MLLLREMALEIGAIRIVVSFRPSAIRKSPSFKKRVLFYSNNSPFTYEEEKKKTVMIQGSWLQTMLPPCPFCSMASPELGTFCKVQTFPRRIDAVPERIMNSLTLSYGRSVSSVRRVPGGVSVGDSPPELFLIELSGITISLACKAWA